MEKTVWNDNFCYAFRSDNSIGRYFFISRMDGLGRWKNQLFTSVK